MNQMSNIVEYTTKKRHNHENLRTAMKWHKLSHKDLGEIAGFSAKTCSRRLSGQTPFKISEMIKILDGLKLRSYDLYFRSDYNAEEVVSFIPTKANLKRYQPGMGITVELKEPWEVKDRGCVAIEINGETFAGSYGCGEGWAIVWLSDDRYFAFTAKDIRSGKINFLGEVRSVYQEFN